MDPEAMKMFAQEGDVFHIEEEPTEDLAAMIMPLDGIIIIWPFENSFSNVVFNDFESFNLVSNYPINEINLNFDYLHVFSGNETLNIEKILNDEHLINKEDKTKIKPIENETTKINRGTLGDPKEVRIISTLSSQEQEALIELLKDYSKVFAWSYKYMPRINPDIVQHRILTLPEVKSVKQKLRRMKLD